MSDRRRRIRAPLLDRLLDDDPNGPLERPPLRVLPRNDFAKSVVRDLSWLFNTRCTARIQADGSKRAHTGTVIDYGLEDFSHLMPASQPDREALARAVKTAIAAFEPRLQVHRVVVSPIEGRHLAAEILCEAYLVADEVREPVSFRVRVNTSEGTVELDGR